MMKFRISDVSDPSTAAPVEISLDCLVDLIADAVARRLGVPEPIEMAPKTIVVSRRGPGESIEIPG